MTVSPDMAPGLYAPGDLIPLDLDLAELLGLKSDSAAPEAIQRAMAQFTAQWQVDPRLPVRVHITMPKASEVQRILWEKQFAEEKLEARSYDMEPEVYAAQKADMLERFQARVLAFVQLPEGSTLGDPAELPPSIVNHLWDTVLYFGSGLTRREVQGSTGRSGSGSPGPETTTASVQGARVVDATIPRPKTKRSTG